MIANTLMHQITLGREGRNKGYSMGLPKLEGININRSTNIATDKYSRKYPVEYI